MIFKFLPRFRYDKTEELTQFAVEFRFGHSLDLVFLAHKFAKQTNTPLHDAFCAISIF